MSEKGQTSQPDKPNNDDEIPHDHQITISGQMPDSGDLSDDDNLTYDWEDCEIRQIVKAFPISDYGTKSDLSSIEYPLVPEPPSLSGITDSTIPPGQTQNNIRCGRALCGG